MLFHKSLVSFVAAIALASGVAASTTPVRRDEPPPVTPAQCTATNNNLTCCNSSSILTVSDSLAAQLLPLGLDINFRVGLDCTVTGSIACGTQQALCCQNVINQQGIVNVAINCVTIAV